MPKNRRSIDREQKLTEILECAEELYLKRGFEATTMADLAAGIGIAQNAIYWYFPSKDHLLVAVLERKHERVMKALVEVESLGGRLKQTLETVFSVLRELQPLVDVMRARAGYSDVIVEFRRRFHLHLRKIVADALKRAAPGLRNRELLADAVISLVEGALIYETPEHPAERIAVTAIGRIIRDGKR